MRKHGCNNQDYMRIYGNQVQQVVHQECIRCIEKVALLPVASSLYEHQGTLVQCVDSAREYNQLGLTHKAACIVDFCHSLLDYGKVFLEGAAEGALGAVRSCYEHPLQTALCCAVGEYVLAYNLLKVLGTVAEIGVTALYDGEKALEKWDDFVAPVVRVASALYNKEVSLRDAIKGSAHFIACWKTESKLLRGLGGFFNGAKKKSLAFAAKNPDATPEHYMATPEGYFFRVARVAENNKVAKNIKCVRAEPKREIILPRVKTYEQARNKGLEIIGEVDRHTGIPMTGKQGSVDGKLCGRRWHGYKVTLRLDHDDVKGAHINVTDCREGKRLAYAIPFEGSIELIESLCKRWNTRACLEEAKNIFEKVGDVGGLSDVEAGLNILNERNLW